MHADQNPHCQKPRTKLLVWSLLLVHLSFVYSSTVIKHLLRGRVQSTSGVKFAGICSKTTGGTVPSLIADSRVEADLEQRPHFEWVEQHLEHSHLWSHFT